MGKFTYFFRRKSFVIYLSYFILIFMHDVFELFDTSNAKFYMIYIFGYMSVIFLKGKLRQNPMLHWFNMPVAQQWHSSM